MQPLKTPRKPPSKNERIQRIAICGLLAAVACVILLTGAMIDILDLTCATLAAFAVIYARIRYGFTSAFCVYACATVTALMILPRSAVVIFGVMTGPYALIKAFAEKQKKIFSYLIKFSFFNAVFAAALAIQFTLMGLADKISPKLIPVIILGGNAVFLVADIALTKVITVLVMRRGDLFGRRRKTPRDDFKV